MSNTANEKRNVSVDKIKSVIDELESRLQKKERQADAEIQNAKYSASESFISDMKGYSRGINQAKHLTIAFLNTNLLPEDGSADDE